MSNSNATASPESTQDENVKTSKLHEAIEKEYYETGHVRKGYTLRYATSGGETKVVIEKA